MTVDRVKRCELHGACWALYPANGVTYQCPECPPDQSWGIVVGPPTPVYAIQRAIQRSVIDARLDGRFPSASIDANTAHDAASAVLNALAVNGWRVRPTLRCRVRLLRSWLERHVDWRIGPRWNGWPPVADFVEADSDEEALAEMLEHQ